MGDLTIWGITITVNNITLWHDVLLFTNNIREIEEKTMATVKINGMSCQHCVASTKKALEEIDGIRNVQVDLENKEATYDGEVDQKVIKDAITSIGFVVVS